MVSRKILSKIAHPRYRARTDEAILAAVPEKHFSLSEDKLVAIILKELEEKGNIKNQKTLIASIQEMKVNNFI